MKYAYSTLAFGLTASAAVVSRQTAQCCFQLQANGAVNGTLGQLADGQNRVGPQFTSPATYCIQNGGLTDQSGRGCILTPPSQQLQCDTGATPTPGFTVSSSGQLLGNGTGSFYACAADANNDFNIYSQPVSGSYCVAITLSTVNGACSGSGVSSSASASASKPASSAPASSAPASSAAGSSAPASSAAASSASASSAPASTVATSSSKLASSAASASSAPASPTVKTVTSVLTSTATSAKTSVSVVTSVASAATSVQTSVVSAPSAGPATVTVTKPVTVTVTAPCVASSSPAGGASACDAAMNACRTAPGANQAECSANYCQCLSNAGALASGPAYCQGGSATSTAASTPKPASASASAGSASASKPASASTVAGSASASASMSASASTLAGSASASASNSASASSLAVTASASASKPASASSAAASSPASASASASAPASKPASASSAAATSATSTGPAGAQSTCPMELTGNWQYPHLIVPVSSTSPNTAAGTQYFGTVSSTISTIFNFDVPASYAGKTCTLMFSLPTQAQLETSSFTLSGSGSVDFKSLSGVATQSTTYANAPAVKSDLGMFTVTPGSAVTVATGPCAAGSTVAYEMAGTGSFNLNYFQDYNPCPIGLYILSA